MTTAVLDSSAVLAVIQQEPGAEAILARVSMDNVISAVNLEEVRTKLVDKGIESQIALKFVHMLHVRVESFTDADAVMASDLRNPTRHLGLSLGDRACLALGQRLNAVVMTADRVWKELSLPVQVEVIR